jgi:hypothetical protein
MKTKKAPKEYAAVYRRAAERMFEYDFTKRHVFSCHAIQNVIGSSPSYYSGARLFYVTVFDLLDWCNKNIGFNYYEGMMGGNEVTILRSNEHRVIALLTLAAAIEAGDF